jgi:hypothetical protein
MTLPEQRLLKRRLQILDDETRDGHGFDVREHENIWAHADMWIRSFMARLAGLVRKIGDKS